MANEIFVDNVINGVDSTVASLSPENKNSQAVDSFESMNLFKYRYSKCENVLSILEELLKNNLLLELGIRKETFLSNLYKTKFDEIEGDGDISVLKDKVQNELEKRVRMEIGELRSELNNYFEDVYKSAFLAANKEDFEFMHKIKEAKVSE